MQILDKYPIQSPKILVFIHYINNIRNIFYADNSHNEGVLL